MSGALEDEIGRRVGRAWGRIPHVTVYNAIDHTVFHPPDPVQQHSRASEQPEVLFVGAVQAHKGPQVLLEGMASGLAVLARRRGGIPEVGGDAIQYFDTPQQLTAMLQELIAHAEVRDEWGEKAQSRAQEFTWDRSVDTLTEFVAATAPGTSPPAS